MSLLPSRKISFFLYLQSLDSMRLFAPATLIYVSEQNARITTNGQIVIASCVTCIYMRGGFRATATSKMECFVIIVNGFQPLTIITKRSILGVAAALDPPLLTKLLVLFRLLC